MALALVPTAATGSQDTVDNNFENEAVTPGKDKKDKKVTRRKELLMLELLLKGKETEIKTDTPYLMAQLKNMKRVAIIVSQMVEDPNLIETAEIAFCSKDLVKLGSPREKEQVNTHMKDFDTTKIKKVGDISPYILVGFLRQHAKKEITDSAIKIVCNKSHKLFYIIWEYLTGTFFCIS